MPQLFPPAFDLAARFLALGVVLLLAGGTYSAYLLNRSPYWTNVGVTPDQPVAFSHKHHAGELGIDCRFCHTSVEKSNYAGMPDTQTCMTCHSQIWKNSPALAAVRKSFAEDKPLKWNRVVQDPGFVYFNHSIHVNKGVGCSTCHGRIDLMPLTWKTVDTEMQWCLSCHRHPEQSIRKLADIYRMDWAPAQDPRVGVDLVKAHQIQKDHLADCSACHR